MKTTYLLIDFENLSSIDLTNVPSKDTGFDPLQKHLQEININCERKETFAKIEKIEPPQAIFIKCEEWLKKEPKSRPKSIKTLKPYLFQRTKHDFKESEFNDFLEYLKRNNTLEIDDKGKLKYKI